MDANDSIGDIEHTCTHATACSKGVPTRSSWRPPHQSGTLATPLKMSSGGMLLPSPQMHGKIVMLNLLLLPRCFA